MALHPEFPKSPYAELLPDQRWFPAATSSKTNGKASAPHTCTLAVKVIDIFGNDTMVLVPVSVG